MGELHPTGFHQWIDSAFYLTVKICWAWNFKQLNQDLGDLTGPFFILPVPCNIHTSPLPPIP